MVLIEKHRISSNEDTEYLQGWKKKQVEKKPTKTADFDLDNSTSWIGLH